MDSTKTIEACSVYKKYALSNSNADYLQVLVDLNFSLNFGESLGIIGRNGSGKSTLLKILSGVTKPDNGIITLRGRVSSILDLGFGMVTELTGRENVNLQISLAGKFTGAEKKVLFQQVVDFAELWEFIERPVKNYSSGMFLRLAFATKTIIKPDILLLDEVIAVGDISFQLKCKEKIRELKKQGVSIILISHNLSEIMEMSNKCILLQNGQIVKSGLTRNVVDYYYTLNDKKQELFTFADEEGGDPLFKLSKINILSVAGEFAQTTIYHSEPFSVSLKLEKFAKSPECDIIVYVFDYKGIVMSDSLIYRSGEFHIGAGSQDATLVINFPPFLFNQGTYSITFIIGNDENTFIRATNCCKFTILVDDWEKDKIWNNNGEVYPFRPQLDWRISDNHFN